MKCSYSTKHTRDTPVPQNYCEHWKVAVGKSAKLIWFGLAGILHGFLPEIKSLQFYTSTQVLKAAKFLMYSGRHDKEITAIFGSDVTTLIAFKRGLGTYKPGDGTTMNLLRGNGCTRRTSDPLCGFPDQYGWSCCGHMTESSAIISSGPTVGQTWVNVDYPKPTPLWHHDV